MTGSGDRQARVVDDTLSSMQGAVALPRSNGELVFDAPWQSRAFGVAVTLAQSGYFSWDAFRASLAEAIAVNGQDGIDDYYLRWLDALEESILDANLVDVESLSQRMHEFRNQEREEVL